MTFARILVLLSVLLLPNANCNAENLIVGVNIAGNPPLTFAKKQGNKGIYCDILSEVAKLTDLSFSYVYLPPKRLLFAFDQGEIQIEPGINPSWRETDKLPGVYTVSFATNENVILFAKGKKLTVRSPIDLLGHQVGTIRGYYYPGYMELFASRRIIRAEGNSEYNLMSRLATGRFDQIFIQKDVAYYWMSQEKRFSKFEVGNVNFRDPIMFRLHPSKRHVLSAFDKAINQLLKSGKIAAIYAKYR